MIERTFPVHQYPNEMLTWLLVWLHALEIRYEIDRSRGKDATLRIFPDAPHE